MIEHILITSFCIVGIHLAVKEFVWTFTGAEVDAYYVTWPKWLQYVTKPLFMCPTCMASVWGTTIHFYLGGDLHGWIPTVLAVAFLNTLLNKWVK